MVQAGQYKFLKLCDNPPSC